MKKAMPFTYRKEIDGLRALAVLPVILFHAGFSLLPGGYTGVDIFFVISGYLITSILIKDLDNNNFSFVSFYERRARRILPAVFIVTFTCIPVAVLLMHPSQLKSFSEALIAISLFSSNILFWKKEDYFAPDAEENPLLHTWSLGVEEQFYIFFPILLLIMWKNKQQSIFFVVTTLCITSILLSEWGWRNTTTANFYLLPTRAWELGVGSLCALTLFKKAITPNSFLAIGGFASIILSFFIFDEGTPFPSIYATLPVFGTALIIIYASPSNIIGKLLSAKLLVGIGLISFSIYLWHQPLIAFTRIYGNNQLPEYLLILVALLSIPLAYLSWKYVEQPFRKTTNNFFKLQNLVIFCTFCSLTLIITGTYGILSNGLLNFWSNRSPEISKTYKIIMKDKENKSIGPKLEKCQFRSHNFSNELIQRIEKCKIQHGKGLLIIGDSHGIDIFNGMILNKMSNFIVGLVGGGCRIGSKSNKCEYNEASEFLNKNTNIFSKIFYNQTSLSFLYKGDTKYFGRKIFSHSNLTEALDINEYHLNKDQLLLTKEYLLPLSKTHHLVWIGPRIEPHISINYIIRNGCEFDFSLREGQFDIFQKVNTEIKSTLKATGIDYIDQLKMTKFNIKEDFINCDNWYWSDGDHWSLTGSEVFTKRLFK